MSIDDEFNNNIYGKKVGKNREKTGKKWENDKQGPRKMN